MELIIGDQNLSSWSMRAWLVAKASGLKFNTVKILLDRPETSKKINKHSPSGRVPLLKDGATVIWDSLAIAEYLAEKSDAEKHKAALWPENAKARAHARSICSEMHSSFMGLRAQCSMDIGLRMQINHLTSGTREDIRRIVEIWKVALKKSGGPYLFGKEFGIADAFYAPVVFRFISYGIVIKDPLAKKYIAAIQKNNYVKEWLRGAKKETPYRPKFS